MKTISITVFILNKENIISTIIMSLCLPSIDDILSNMYNTVCRISTLYCCLHSSPLFTTVVPALGDPVYGHVINVILPAIGGHLPNADSRLLVVRSCYNGQCKQMPRFRWSFQPKSLAARTLGCDRQFAQISMLPSGDRKQYFISRVNACMMNHLIGAIQTIWLHLVYDIMS